MPSKLLQIRNLSKRFGTTTAFEDINLEIGAGEIVGLVGESGSGKSTLGKAIVQLVKPCGGNVVFKGIDLNTQNSKALRSLRKHMQIIFQNPKASLNPKMRIGQILREPYDIHKIDGDVETDIQSVGLSLDHLGRYPDELSGGQLQRVCIARALAVQPEFMVCDEPLSALDVLIRAQIIDLLKSIHYKKKISYLFITHDLTTLRGFAHRIAVMHKGRIVEIDTPENILNHPVHPYTKMLINAIPTRDPVLERKKVLRIDNQEKHC